MSNNRLWTLRGVPKNLVTLNAQGNILRNMDDVVGPLRSARQLARLSLCDVDQTNANPVCAASNYRKQMFAALPSLKLLDYMSESAQPLVVPNGHDLLGPESTEQMTTKHSSSNKPLDQLVPTQDVFMGKQLFDAATDVDGRLSDLGPTAQKISDTLRETAKMLEQMENADPQQQVV